MSRNTDNFRTLQFTFSALQNAEVKSVNSPALWSRITQHFCPFHFHFLHNLLIMSSSSWEERYHKDGNETSGICSQKRIGSPGYLALIGAGLVLLPVNSPWRPDCDTTAHVVPAPASLETLNRWVQAVVNLTQWVNAAKDISPLFLPKDYILSWTLTADIVLGIYIHFYSRLILHNLAKPFYFYVKGDYYG